MSHATCGLCDATFARQSDCSRHESGHRPDSFIPCQNCDFISTRKDSMKRHMTRKHPINSDSAEPNAFKTNQQNLSDNKIQTLDVPQSDKFDKRLQLPHNFIYAGASQSVSLVITDPNMIYVIYFAGKNPFAHENTGKCKYNLQSSANSSILYIQL